MIIFSKYNKTKILYTDKLSIEQVEAIVMSYEAREWDVCTRNLYKNDRS